MGLKKISPGKWIKWGIPAIFASGALLHFAYKFSGSNPVVGALAPVNESVWEHAKLAYLPTVLWWGGYYIKNRQNLDRSKWATATCIALLACILMIPSGYYFYTEAFGRQILAVDISLFAIAATVGQVLGFHVFRRGKGRISTKTAAVIIAVIGALFIYFTFNPPDLPIFQEH